MRKILFLLPLVALFGCVVPQPQPQVIQQRPVIVPAPIYGPQPYYGPRYDPRYDHRHIGIGVGPHGGVGVEIRR